MTYVAAHNKRSHRRLRIPAQLCHLTAMNDRVVVVGLRYEARVLIWKELEGVIHIQKRVRYFMNPLLSRASVDLPRLHAGHAHRGAVRTEEIETCGRHPSLGDGIEGVLCPT
jgi:hypothetical protein